MSVSPRALNSGVPPADEETMLIASPVARTVLIVVLVAAATALMISRLALGNEPVAAPATSSTLVARHTQGSAAAERRAYRLQHDRTLAAATR
jgi:hypothetical protein